MNKDTIKEFINRLFPNRTTNGSNEFNELRLRKLNSGYVIDIGCQSVAIQAKEDVKVALDIFLEANSDDLRSIWYGYDEMEGELKTNVVLGNVDDESMGTLN